MARSSSTVSQSSSGGGVSAIGAIGMGLAAYCSWMINQSIGWACVHALCGWLYLLYLCLGCGGGFPAGIW